MCFERDFPVARFQDYATVVIGLDAAACLKRKCEIDCRGAGMEEIKRPDIDCAPFEVNTRGCGRFNYHRYANYRFGCLIANLVCVALGLLLIAATLVFERDVLLNFLFQILKLFTGRVFELMKSFGIGFFHLR